MNIGIVGGGIAGLSTAYYLKKQGHSVMVFEAQPEAGGVARTDYKDGYLIDRGPNGFLTNVSEALQLAHEVGLGSELLVASELAKHRFLFKDGRLQALPGSPRSFLSTRLVSTKAKLRLLLEPFAARRPAEDESVYDFARRRVGKEFAEVFMRAMVVGITAGDARQISLSALFPRMRKLEEDYGGLFRALVTRAFQKRKTPEKSGGPAGPGGRLTSFKQEGISKLTQTLSQQLAPFIRHNCPIQALSYHPQHHHYTLSLGSGEQMIVDNLVLATPAYVSAQLLQVLLPDAAKLLAKIPYAGVKVFGLGYDRKQVPHPLNGFGYLVPPGEDQRILGCLWTSSLFPDQAPPGKVLLRIIAGGVLDPEFLKLSDDEALRCVQADLQKSLGIQEAPEMIHQITWEKAIPQYTLGHAERVTSIMSAVKTLKGLYLTGSAYYGVGLNDCVRDAKRVAAEVKAG